MRADRLVAILLLLQAREKVTAAEVARELEISTRTARRDLEALMVAGVPVYSQAGRGGGWSLIGGAKTDLTGLQAAEARALFVAAGQAATGSPELQAALRKLTQALPEPFRADAETAASSVMVDPARWGHVVGVEPDTPFLDELQRVVIERRQIRLGYRTPGKGSSVRVVDPLGLVTKASVWYLVGNTEVGGRTFRLSRIESVEATGEKAVRPPDFDLAAAWNAITVNYVENSGMVVATGWAAPWTLPIFRRMIGDHFEPGETREDGWSQVTLRSYSWLALAAQISGLAAGLEIVEPQEVRDALADIGLALTATYAKT